jgi:hypothetical protein
MRVNANGPKCGVLSSVLQDPPRLAPMQAFLTRGRGVVLLLMAAWVLTACGGSNKQSSAGSTTPLQSASSTSSTHTSTSSTHTSPGHRAHDAKPAPGSPPRKPGEPRARHTSGGGAASVVPAGRHRSGLGRGAPARGAAPPIAAGLVIHSFSGVGNATIGSLSEKTAIVLEWHAGKPPFQVFISNGFRMVDSRARTGRIRIRPGRYRSVHVATRGAWTILLRTAQ